MPQPLQLLDVPANGVHPISSKCVSQRQKSGVLLWRCLVDSRVYVLTLLLWRVFPMSSSLPAANGESTNLGCPLIWRTPSYATTPLLQISLETGSRGLRGGVADPKRPRGIQRCRTSPLSVCDADDDE